MIQALFLASGFACRTHRPLRGIENMHEKWRDCDVV